MPGASTNLVLTFAPVTQGSKSAVLRLTSNDADTATLDVPLAGTALAPLVADIVVASDTLDFAAIAVFTNVVRLLGVRHVGTGNLTVNAPALLGPDAVMFTLANPAAFTLAPGDSTTLTITFTPTSPGTTPITPPSSHDGTSPGGGGCEYISGSTAPAAANTEACPKNRKIEP